MTAIELYHKFHLLFNKNSESLDMSIEKPNFVSIFNRESEKWLGEIIKRNNTTDDIFDIQELEVSNTKVVKEQIDSDKVIYSLPEDFYNLSHTTNYSIVEKNNCKGIVYNYYRKPNDFQISIEDKFTKPSFDWERGLQRLSGNKLYVYKTDFEIKETFISYYKSIKIDLAGYKHRDGSNSINKEPEASDYLLEQILDRVVTEFTRQFSKEDLQISLERQTH